MDLPDALREASVLSVGGGGVLLLDQQSRTSTAGQTLHLLDADGRVTTVPRVAPEADRQVIDGAVTEEWVVWQEMAGTSLAVTPWFLYAYDRSTAQVTTVATAAQLAGAPAEAAIASAPGGSVPSIVDDAVYLSAQSGADADAETHVFRVPLAGGRPQRVSAGRGAVATKDGLVFVTRDGDRIVVVQSSHAGEGMTELAATEDGCGSVSAVAAADEVVAWLLDCERGNELHVLHDGAEVVVEGRDLGYVRASSDLVGFARATSSGNYRQYLLLAATDELVPVGSGVVSGNVRLGDGLVAWRAFEDPTGRVGRSRVIRFSPTR